jgi:methylated-DNA-[protein]-cysteine S-methyltransferase
MRCVMHTMRSPLGRLLVVWRADTMQVCGLDFADHDARLRRLLARRAGALEIRDAGRLGGDSGDALDVDAADVGRRLAAYFAGDLRALDAIPVDTGGTRFQQRVWTALRAIPPGATRSYGELARAIGAPRAVRAVGAANGANPVALIVPCHRVIGADGRLTGYAGGLERKRWLLAHEGACAAVDRGVGQRAHAASIA